MDSYLPEQLNAKLEYISAGGSVANTALSILMYLGFHKIIAIGLDLAFFKKIKNMPLWYMMMAESMKRKTALYRGKRTKWRNTTDI